jgi:hypothetical protein
MKSPRLTYEQHAEKFARAVDIGLKILEEADISPRDKERLIRLAESDKEMALNPPPIYKKVASLNCIIAEQLYYWNEEKGRHVEQFWDELAKNGIDYKRKDIFKTVLKRSRINNLQEYDYILDEILVAHQSHRLTTEELEKLNELLLNYEQKKVTKKSA